MKKYILFTLISVLSLHSIKSQVITSDNRLLLMMDSLKNNHAGDTAVIEYPAQLIEIGKELNIPPKATLKSASVESNNQNSFIAPAALMATAAADLTGKDIGEIPVQSATSNGAVTYMIPIEVPRGNNGLQPGLSLVYNSMGSNGLAGYGWSIGGLGVIEITNSNYYYDGLAAEAAKLDKSSAYSLNGTRLIKTGEDATKIAYQTEQGNVLVFNMANSGKYYFEVKYPDGNTAIFGSKTNTSPKISYPLTRLEDNLGNYIDYTYTELDNYYCLSEIKYGNSQAQIGSVKFTYKTRTDITTSYIAGKMIVQKMLLSQINTYLGSTQLLQYNLTHKLEDYNLLTEVGCKADGRELNPLKFQYGDGNSGGYDYYAQGSTTTLSSYFTTSGKDLIISKAKLSATNNNDALFVYPKFNPYTITKSAGSAAEFGSIYDPAQNILIYEDLSQLSCTPKKIQVGAGFQQFTAMDINGDGVDEFVKVNYVWESDKGKVTVTTYDKNYTPKSQSFLLEGAFAMKYSCGLFCSAYLRSPFPRHFVFGDFNGDGKIELLTYYGYMAPNGETRDNSSAVLINLESLSIIKEFALPSIDVIAGDRSFAADFNGDGRSDLYLIKTDGTYVYEFINNIYKQIGYTSNLKRATLLYNKTKELLTGDFNGDGKTDLLLSPPKNAYNMISNVHDGNCSGACRSGRIVSTFVMGKGTANLYYDTTYGYCTVYQDPQKVYDADAFDWTYLIATGTGFTQEVKKFTQENISGTDFLMGDINKDNLPDLIVKANNEVSVYLNKEGMINTTVSPVKLYISESAYFVPGNLLSMYGYRSSQFLSIKDYTVTPYSYSRDVKRSHILTQSVTSHGVVTQHTYANMAEGYPYYTTSATPAGYPYSKMHLNIYLTIRNRKYLNDNMVEASYYNYEDGIVNRQGRGFSGFGKITVKDELRDMTTVQTYDPTNFGILKSVDSPTASGTFNYNIAVAYNKIATVTLANKTEKDKLKDASVTTTYTYDTYGNPTKAITDFGSSIKKTVDTKYNNLTGTPYILGQVNEQTLTSDRGGFPSVVTKSIFVYNTKGLPTSKKEYYNNNLTLEEAYSYDPTSFNLNESKSKSYTSGNWIATKYTYDNLGRVSRKTDPMGLYIDNSYNTKGQLLSTKNHKGHEIKYEYDSWGRKIKTTYADGTIESTTLAWTSTPAGALTLVTNTTTGQPAKQVYADALGREIRQGVMRFDGKYIYTDILYDNKGRVQKMSLPFKGASPVQWNTYTYDSYDRLTVLNYASGKKDSYSYDKYKITETKDNVSKATVSDATGNVLTVTDPAGTIIYYYRADGQVSRVVAPGDITTTFEYDTYGRQTKIIDPSAGTKTFAYDVAGNISQETDANGKVTKMTYDIYNRVTKKEVTGELTTDYTYNTDGQVTSVSGNNGTSKAYTYDALMRISTAKETVPDGKWLQKTFAYSAGNIASIAYTSHSGSIVTENYVYTNGHASEIKLNNTTSIWKLTQENDLGLITAANTGILARTYGYDAYGMPTARTVKNGTATIQNFGYNFNATTGNLNWRKDNNRNIQENFIYDNLNRLTGFGSKTITYDFKGNITDYSTVGKFEYNLAEKPYAVTAITPYGTEIPLRNQAITYNGMMRPATINDANGYSASFVYNTDGGRVKMQVKKNNVDELIRYYIGGQYETDSGIAGAKERLYLGGDTYSAAAVYVKEGTGAWTVYYMGRDYLGSITHIIDAAGAVKQELSYDPWGRLRNPADQKLYAIGSEPALFLGRGYTGHEHLTMFGLINMNARLYDPVVGRFLSPDPYVQAPDWSQNYNRYSYCLNNPLKYNDESGEIFGFLTGVMKGALNFWKGLGKWAFGGGSFTRDVLQATAQPIVNGIKIDAGMFAGNLEQIFSRWTWELPQSLMGYYTAATHNAFGGVKSVSFYGGATVIESYSNTGAIPLFGSGAGVTMGSFIIGQRGIKADPTNSLFQHEYGHYLQSQAYGWAFLPKFGIPSSLSASKDDGKHKFRAFEQDANARSLEYFTGKYGHRFAQSSWKFESNPIIGYNQNLSFYNRENRDAIYNARIKFNSLDLVSWTPLTWVTGFIYNNQYEKKFKY